VCVFFFPFLSFFSVWMWRPGLSVYVSVVCVDVLSIYLYVYVPVCDVYMSSEYTCLLRFVGYVLRMRVDVALIGVRVIVNW
jgi:hypothetical protein